MARIAIGFIRLIVSFDSKIFLKQELDREQRADWKYSECRSSGSSAVDPLERIPFEPIERKDERSWLGSDCWDDPISVSKVLTSKRVVNKILAAWLPNFEKIIKFSLLFYKVQVQWSNRCRSCRNEVLPKHHIDAKCFRTSDSELLNQKDQRQLWPGFEWKVDHSNAWCWSHSIEGNLGKAWIANQWFAFEECRREIKRL